MTTALYSDTRCIAVIIEGTKGDVIITKMNRKSFRFEGKVDVLRKDYQINVKGTAKYWKDSLDGTKAYYKCGSALLTIIK